MTGGNPNGAAEDRIRQIVEEVLQGTPMYVVELHLKGRKGSQVVDVFVDSDEVLDVEELARVSRQVGFLLETQEVLGGAYHLNVSSPGVNRPLVPRQFKKNVGRKLKVKYKAGEADATVEGTLAEADEESIELAPAKGDALRIPVADVVEARVQLPW